MCDDLFLNIFNKLGESFKKKNVKFDFFFPLFFFFINVNYALFGVGL